MSKKVYYMYYIFIICRKIRYQMDFSICITCVLHVYYIAKKCITQTGPASELDQSAAGPLC